MLSTRIVSIAAGAAVVAVALSTAAQATLINNGNGLIYDTDLNITWLQDASYAATEMSDTLRNTIIGDVGNVSGHTLTTGDFNKNGADYTGQMTWWGAMAWANALVFDGITRWRLPAMALSSSTLSPVCGAGIIGIACASVSNELAYLYYIDLGGVGGSLTGTQQSGGVTIYNITGGQWSDAETDSSSAWSFNFTYGYNEHGDKGNEFIPWAVHDGDIGTTTSVPEPSTLALFGAGIIGLFGVRALRSKAVEA